MLRRFNHRVAVPACRCSEREPLNILFASSEVVPFAKTGGLADVGEALPRALAKLGHEPVVFLPAYREAKKCGQPLETTNISFTVTVGSKQTEGRLLKSSLRQSDVPVYLVEQDTYFDRPELYREQSEDYQDNCERFSFFCRAVMESARLLGIPFDVLHANDWQTGLIPAYLQTTHANLPPFQHTTSLFTLHNLAYQGHFWHWDMLLTGLDWKYFNWHQMEFYGYLNLLKTGIVFADAISTVSPRYSHEIQTSPLGCGLERVLQHRSQDLFGILNGVDYDVWDPSHDELIAAPYDGTSWPTGKARCKAALQQELGLPVSPHVPLIGMIGRLANQKGWDLVGTLMERWVPHRDVQWAILGTGEKAYQQLLQRLSAKFPEKVAACFEFSDSIAHRIEAGTDMFLMASQYEPCGLNQLYSLRYGSVPIVHRTGGLTDTITDASPDHLRRGSANGFSFAPYDLPHLEEALARACQMYAEQPNQWEQLVTAGMNQDWSWTRSAQEYVELYQQITSRKRAGG
jgi:starch synthase